MELQASCFSVFRQGQQFTQGGAGKRKGILLEGWFITLAKFFRTYQINRALNRIK
jgi:hypothetical protein